MESTIRIQSEPFDAGTEIAGISGGAGAVAAFTGYVRGEDGVTALRLEHYPGMTEREIAACIREAESRWRLLAAVVIHRIGELKAGDQIVMVAVASLHRREAFAACEFLMDQLKTTVPFWKEQQKGTSRSWVEVKQSDKSAAERWINLRR